MMGKLDILIVAAALTCLPQMARAETLAASPAPASEDIGPAFNELVHRLTTMWILACDTPGMNETAPEIRFTISPNGYLSGGPMWANRHDDPVWVVSANRAISAIKKAEPYSNLPEGLYNRPIRIIFDARKACQGR